MEKGPEADGLGGLLNGDPDRRSGSPQSPPDTYTTWPVM